MKKMYITIALCSMSLLYASISAATVMMTNDRIAFEALGTIEYNYGFDEFGTGFSSPGNPWTTHGVTYTNSDNLIIGTDTPYSTNGSSMMSNNYWNPLKGDVDASAAYDLFGFDSGWMNIDDGGTLISIMTNLNNYSFNVDLNQATHTDFFGFVADAGEYMTGFNIFSSVHHALVGMDNVTVGHQNNEPVPEPATMLLMGTGLLGLVGYNRKRFNKKN